MADVSGLTEEEFRKLLIQMALEQGNLTGMSQQAQVAGQQGAQFGNVDIPQSRHWSAQLAQGLRGGLQGAKMGEQNKLNKKVSEGQSAGLKRMSDAVSAPRTPPPGIAQPPIAAGQGVDMTGFASPQPSPFDPAGGMPGMMPGQGYDVQAMINEVLRKKQGW